MKYIIRPLVTEKMNRLTEKEKQYGFIVNPQANKVQIKEEIESLYNVSVVGISTMVYAGKNKSRYTRSGFTKGRTNAFKKAVVTLKDGDTIDFYSNI
jgi:large subunit ribosomal protein L23